MRGHYGGFFYVEIIYIFIMHNIQSVERYFCVIFHPIFNLFYFLSVIRDRMTLSESLSGWFIKAVDVSIIRSFIIFFHNYISYIKFQSWDWKPVTHKLRTYKFLLDCTLNYYNFLSLCDGGGGKETEYLYLSFFIPCGQHSVSVQTKAACSYWEMYG